MSDPNAPGSVPPDEPISPPTLPKIVPMSDDEPLPGDAPASDEASLPETALVAETTPPAGSAPIYPEATTQMPVAGAFGAMPPGPPPGTGFGEPLGSEPPTPWYKKPAPILAAIVVVAAIAGLIAWLLFGGGDDDDPVATAESSLLVLEVTDETGTAVDTGFIIDVQGPATAPADYTWIQPESAVAGQLAGDSTGSDGRVEFEWEPAGAASDPTTWAANVTLAQKVPAGWTPPGPIVDCILDRPDSQETVVSMAVTVNVPDPALEQVADYSFPNYQFLAGDTLTCRLSTIRPVETTTTSTTIEETTTTTSTTVAETTTTAAPTTSAPVVTVPPQPEATLWDVIVNSPDLSELRALVELAGLQDVLSDPNATLTLLAPSNQAITTAAGGVGAPDFTNPAIVEAVLLTHVDDTQVLLITQLLALDPPEFVVVNPGPHAIDAAASPPTIGGAEVLVADIEAANGVLHVIDMVLLPQTLPE